jgi:hypothetical protein
VFTVFNFVFPQHFATATEKIGNYELAVNYASLRYTYTQDSYDLARVVEDSILSEKDEYVLQYGEKFIALDNFEEVAATRGEQLNIDYSTYVCGKIAVARYNSGDFDGALQLAADTNGKQSFKSGNTLIALSIRVISVHDKQNAKVLESTLDEISTTDAQEQELLNNFKKRLRTEYLG